MIDLERVVSFIGLLAIGAWLWRWTSNYAQRRKELSEVEKDLRESLKDALEHERSMRSHATADFSALLATAITRATELEVMLSPMSDELAATKRRELVAKTASDLAASMARLRATELLEGWSRILWPNSVRSRPFEFVSRFHNETFSRRNSRGMAKPPTSIRN